MSLGQKLALDDAIVIAVGGNMSRAGESVEITLSLSLDALAANGVSVLKRSSFWRSKAWPDPAQNDYLNAVCLVETALGPAALLERLHRIERDFGRRRGEGDAPNAPRTLDLDLIAYGRRVQEGPPILPHPRAADRLFVMGPLVEIAPDWTFPGLGERASALAARASVGPDAAPV